MNVTKVNLHKGNDGRWILSKDAVQILRNAEKITVSYNKNVRGECFMMAETTKKYAGQEFEMMWMMDINALEHQYTFRTTVTNHSKSAFQMLIKPECSVTFIPASNEDGLDSIRFIIHVGSKTITGVFDQKMHKDKPGIDIVTKND